MLVLSVGISLYNQNKPAEKTALDRSGNTSPAGRKAVKMLLILYIIFLPVGVLQAFLQNQLPVKIALLGLIVPVLVMIGLIRILRNRGGQPRSG